MVRITTYEYGHDAWYAWGHYAVSEYLGSGSYTKYQNLVDLLLGIDGDNDGGIFQGIGGTNSDDFAWTTNAMQAASNMGLVAPPTYYTVSGTVTLGGSGLAGVTMSGLTGNPVTNASGVYRRRLFPAGPAQLRRQKLTIHLARPVEHTVM